MREFSDSLPASELEHLWLNIYFRKYICMHAFKLKLNKLNEEEDETTTISNFLHLFTLNLTKKFWFNILKTISWKIKKKTSTEPQSEGHAILSTQNKCKPLGRLTRTNPRKLLYRKREIQSSCTWKNCMVNVIPTLWLPIQKWKLYITP